MSPRDCEIRRQDLLTQLKSKMEATELKYQEELKSQAAAATKKKENDTESTETLGSKLAEAEKLV